MTTIKYTTFKNVAALTTAMETVVTDSKTLQDRIQDIAWGILCHAYKHGDYTLAGRMVNELADGIRRAALVEFFVLAGLKVNETGDGFGDWAGADYIKANADMLKSTMWWTLKKEQPFKGFDLQAELARLLKKAEKMQKEALEMPADDNRKGMVKVSPELLTQLKVMTAAPAHMTVN